MRLPLFSFHHWRFSFWVLNVEKLLLFLFFFKLLLLPKHCQIHFFYSLKTVLDSSSPRLQIIKTSENLKQYEEIFLRRFIFVIKVWIKIKFKPLVFFKNTFSFVSKMFNYWILVDLYFFALTWMCTLIFWLMDDKFFYLLHSFSHKSLLKSRQVHFMCEWCNQIFGTL